MVLLIVAAGIGILAALRPPAFSIRGTASKDGDNIVFTPSTGMVPTTIPATEWDYAVYRGATRIYPTAKDWESGTATLERAIPTVIVATGVQVGDVLKIRYKGEIFDTLIRG